jgi:hypothetical protein
MRVPCKEYDEHDCEECAHWTDRNYGEYYCPIHGCAHHPAYGMCYFIKKEKLK